MSGVRIGRAFFGKMRLRVTIALVLLLAVVICGWIYIRVLRLQADSHNSIEVYMNEMLEGRIDSAWLSQMESIQVEIRGEMITCVSLIDTLESMSASPTSRESILIEGKDEPVSLPAKAILAQWSSYIVYEVNGRPLSPENGGPYRMMVTRPDGSVLSVNSVERITVQLME